MGIESADVSVVAAAAIGAFATITTALIAAGLIGRRVDKVEAQSARVVAEVSPNGGSSMKDQLTAYGNRLDAVEQSQVRTENGVTLLLRAAGIEPDTVLAETPEIRR